VRLEAEPAGTWERHAFAACAPLGEYRRREPERTLLHAAVRERLEPFLRTAKVLPGFADGVESEEDALAALQAAEVERRLRFPDSFRSTRTSASLDGFSLHAGVRVHEHDRDGLERLCRYAVRPPFALDRLSRGEDGRLVYRMKRPRGGSLFLLLTPDELLAKLATLVLPPRVHGIRYHGVFAPNCKVRARVVPPPPEPDSGAEPDPSDHAPPGAAPTVAIVPAAPPAGRSTPPPPRDRPARAYRIPWADLLRKVFALDVLACPDCGGRLRVLAFITEATTARRILDCLGLDSTPPPLARAQAPPEQLEPPPEHDGVDPVLID
jgi:hypothetical protein